MRHQISVPCLAIITGFLLFGISNLSAQTFTSGSTGALGELNVTEDTTIPLPGDGILHYTSITVAEGATLRFKTNTATNSPVYLLATEDVRVHGTIDVSAEVTDCKIYANEDLIGKPGPGGYGSGNTIRSRVNPLKGSPGFGPGGGTVDEPYAYHNGHSGSYGNTLLRPVYGGSGALYEHNNSFNCHAGGGGGAILIASTTSITVDGRILANNAKGNANGRGSSGSILLVSNKVEGNGEVNAYPYGRIRIESNTPDIISLKTSPAASSGLPKPAIMVKEPTLKVVSIQETTIPYEVDRPLFDFNAPHLFVHPTDNSVTVKIAATFIPTGTKIQLRLYRSDKTEYTLYDSSPLEGTLESSTATVTIPVEAEKRYIMELQTDVTLD